jgi:histone H3/H4
MAGLLISKTRVKAFLKKQELRVSGDFYEAFNKELIDCLEKIAKRAKSDKRKTVLARDV